MPEVPALSPPKHKQSGLEGHTCNHNIQKVEAGGSKFKTILSSIARWRLAWPHETASY